ncbi:S26 family signal peptidase [Sphingopyxis terrae]
MTHGPSARVGQAMMFDRRIALRVGLVGALVGAVATTITSPPAPRLVWNASASAPLGLWRVVPGAAPQRGDMVVARLAAPWRGIAARRHYLPSNVPLIKRVAAEDGDRICALRGLISVNGTVVAVRRRVDGAGRPMPRWDGCRKLGADEFLLLMEAEDSFDGRYFGVTELADIVGKATPLWLR